jgi:hypothetical protein
MLADGWWLMVIILFLALLLLLVKKAKNLPSPNHPFIHLVVLSTDCRRRIKSDTSDGCQRQRKKGGRERFPTCVTIVSNFCSTSFPTVIKRSFQTISSIMHFI